MSHMYRWRSVSLVCAATAALALSATCARGDDKDHSVEAVWKQQRLAFVYRSAGAVHTCSGLRSRLRSLLVLLGADETVSVSVQGCDDATSARLVHITVASPFVASEKEAENDATAQLVARLRGEASGSTRAAPSFPAHWKTISFANALSLRLTAADCELLKQLRQQVMPKLAVRVVSDRLRCPSDLHSGSRPQLVVAALVMSKPPPDGF
jgi:hypothetical protein